jgi:hypothetical protein
MLPAIEATAAPITDIPRPAFVRAVFTRAGRADADESGMLAVAMIRGYERPRHNASVAGRIGIRRKDDFRPVARETFTFNVNGR